MLMVSVKLKGSSLAMNFNPVDRAELELRSDIAQAMQSKNPLVLHEATVTTFIPSELVEFVQIVIQ